MKKILALLLVAVMCLSLAACNNGDTETPLGGENTENNGDMTTDNDNSNKKFSVDLEGYVANVGNATALGIAQKQNSDVAPVMSKGGIELLSFVNLSSNEDTESKNYIVMSTTEYDANTPEADRNGLTKVTFTKTITENVTTETTGTKYITASEGQITILAVTGFTYTVYENDTLLYEAIQDNDATDTNDQEGVIVLTGLTDGVEYKVDYAGIGEEITITQDEINGEIDKLYSAFGYTFISFVPEGTSQRPDKEQLYITSNNYQIPAYDTQGYESNTMRQSFVIDNTTGYIYAIKNIVIDYIEHGVILYSNKHFDMSVNENGELVFSQIVLNETLSVHRVFKDKFGQKFVYNDKLDIYDAENQTLYYTKDHYFLTDEGDCLYLLPGLGYDISLTGDCPKTWIEIKKIGNGMVKQDISDTEEYNLVRIAGLRGRIENGFFYLSPISASWGFGGTTRVKLSTMESEYNTHNGLSFDYNRFFIIIDRKLYYGYHWGSNAYQNEIGNLVLLLDNCDEVDMWLGNRAEMLRFVCTTITETAYYKIIFDESGNPKAVNEKTYVAPDREVVTLQPINK